MDKENKPNKILVVKELPTQQVNVGAIDGEEYDLVTVEDAITEILEKIRKIEKSVV